MVVYTRHIVILSIYFLSLKFFTTFHLFLYLCLCICVRVYIGYRIWRSEDNLNQFSLSTVRALEIKTQSLVLVLAILPALSISIFFLFWFWVFKTGFPREGLSVLELTSSPG